MNNNITLSVQKRDTTASDLKTQLGGVEQRLKDSEKRFTEIFKQNFDAIVLFKIPDFIVKEANPAAIELFGYPFEALSRDISCLFTNNEAYHAFKNELLNPENIFNGVFLDRIRLVTCHRKEIICMVKANIINLHEDSVLYCVFHDITESIRLEDESRELQVQLIRTNKMTAMGTLASGIAHEINNPNNFIMSNTQILMDVWGDVSLVLKEHFKRNGQYYLGGLSYSEVEETIPQLLQATLDGSRRIKGITENLRGFSSPETSGAFANVSINDVIGFAIKILNNEIKKKCDFFTFIPGSGLPEISGNGHQLEQVIVNLIQNALHALPGRECQINVYSSLDITGTNILIKIEDEGIGMSKEIMEQITDPFFTTKYDQGGTGLGLYVSYMIVKKHGGSLDFKSKPGEGTTAYLKLPVPNSGRN